MKLQVKNLKKSFGNQPVLNNISFEAEGGQIICLRGKSGEGKTTLLRCLNQLEIPDAGEIWMDTEKINWQGNIADKIGLVFQNYNLFPHLSIMENLLLAPRVKKEEESVIRQRAQILLRKLGIAEKAEQYPYQLSGGQKQRAAIARACMLSPKVLCFDEPTSALDKDSIEGIRQIIQDLSAQEMLIVIVTHDDVFADSVATHSYFLENGNIRLAER